MTDDNMPEPVAWRIFDGEGRYDFREDEPGSFDVAWSARYGRKYEPLYSEDQLRATLAEQAESAALTDDERESIISMQCGENPTRDDLRNLCLAIERAVRSKA